MQEKNNSSKLLACFSPLVMITTFGIEIILLLYVAVRYGFNNVTRVVMATMLCLAVFQLAEYNVCEGSWGLDSLTWAKLGYVAITMLPPLGIHLACQIAGTKRPIAVASYLCAVIFIVFFILVGNGIGSQACLGNYVIFEVSPNWSNWYALYYYGWIIASIVFCLKQIKKSIDEHQSRALKFLIAGNLSFLLPTTIVNTIDPSTIRGIPSIMCGFAVILAVVLAIGVMPNYQKFLDKQARKK